MPPPAERRELWASELGDAEVAARLGDAHRHGCGRISELARLAKQRAAMDEHRAVTSDVCQEVDVVTADIDLIASRAGATTKQTCEALGFARSTYYEQRNRKPKKRAQERANLEVEIGAIFKSHGGRYGSPRVHHMLK